MPSQLLQNLLALLLAASAGGCVDTPPPTGDGRLDLTVVPDSLIASGRPLQGSFELRGLDRAAHFTVPVDGAGYQTRSLALAPGVYNLRWHARLQPDFSAEPALEAPEAPAGHTVVIASNRVTSVTVHSSLNKGEAPSPVAAISDSPEPNSRLAQP